MTERPPDHPLIHADTPAQPPGDNALIGAWFDTLLGMLPNAGAGIVMSVVDGRCDEPLLSRTNHCKIPTYLIDIAVKAVKNGTPARQGNAFGQPLRRRGEMVAVMAVNLKVGKPQQEAVLQLLTWGERWLELLMEMAEGGLSGSAIQTTAEATPGAPAKLLRNLLDAKSLDAALVVLADELANRFGCRRVAVGLRVRKRLRLRALSHGVPFDHRTCLAREFSEAMERSAPAGLCVWPESGGDKEHPLQPLAQFTGQSALLAASLGRYAALVLERPAQQPFSAGEQKNLTDIAALTGPILDLKRDQAALLPPRARSATRGLADRLFKPGHHGFKAAAAAVILVALFLALVPGTYRVQADADIAGIVQRVVVAPFDGFIAKASYRAGDTVAAGDVIARMEEKELLLELRKSTSEEEKLDNEYRRALASADRSEALIAQAKLAQVQAETRLLQDKLQRVQLTAPIDGIIISGDLSDALGAPVERGDVLFEVAPLDQYRLILEVDETDIADVQPGQRGRLTLTALPDAPLDFVVERVSPVFLEKEGRVVYRTEAQIAGDGSALRPGMEGVGKIDVGSRSYGWILFHRLLDWLRLKLWLWLP